MPGNPIIFKEGKYFREAKAPLLQKVSLESTFAKNILIMILAIGMGGCAALTNPGGLLYPSGQQMKLSKAVALLQEGDSSAAAVLLNDISADPPVPGVTDEALFLLSILRLGSGGDVNNIAQAQNDLEQLGKEYPSSSWAPLATSLSGFLAAAYETRQQEDKLNESNLSLSQENKELKELNLTLTKELKAVKESNLALTKENSGLREISEKLKFENQDLFNTIEQLKNLDLEQARKPGQ